MGIILSKMNWDISSIFTGNSVLNQAFFTGTTEGTLTAQVSSNMANFRAIQWMISMSCDYQRLSSYDFPVGVAVVTYRGDGISAMLKHAMDWYRSV